MNSIRNGTFVPSSEAERFTLHQTLRSLMPEAVADTLMAHLPPAGWSDVARTSDIDAVRAEIDAIRAEIDALRTDMKERFEKVDKRFDKIDERFDRMEARFDELASMKRYVITTSIAIIATIIAMGSPLWFDLL
jgi:hypothetical protein